MTAPSSPGAGPFSFNRGWLAGYLIMLAAVVGGVWYGRRQALAVYGSQQAQTDWDDWRSDAKKMAEQPGPVNRREPKSAEPPALVLMRDRFLVCLLLAVVLSSVLFGTFMIFIRGAMNTPGPRPLAAEARPPTPDS